MSKTNMIIIAVIAVYLIVIFPKMGTSKNVETENKSNTSSNSDLSENADNKSGSLSTLRMSSYVN